jgi:hypothetical protein
VISAELNDNGHIQEEEREQAFEQQWPQDQKRVQLEHTIHRQNSIQLVLLLSDTDMPKAINPSAAGGRTTQREINAKDHPSDEEGWTYPQAQRGMGKLYKKNMLNFMQWFHWRESIPYWV